ncbi:DUF3601 domain-containing protein [Steroidobacter cummioxidans]|uniref:DUF3601 domain-containing protein n=1 Tax=Steroidobacter cummioxidans TaxID=1803913 RepID=UPI00137B0475|nr:DUF3601 domain-containing protein [Steroidobacter cummioxidans]
MYGPESIGYWSDLKAPNCGSKHQHLMAGKRYRVAREFRDYDRDTHPIGESWVFMGYSFLPYDDGLSLFVSLDGKQEWHIPMQWRPEEQGPVLGNLAEYVAEEI